VSELDAGGAVGEDLGDEPIQQRERHAKAWHPVHDVPPNGLVRDQHQKVADEVHRGQPAPRRCEQRDGGGPQQDLREVHDEEHAEAARLRRGRVAHVPGSTRVELCRHANRVGRGECGAHGRMWRAMRVGAPEEAGLELPEVEVRVGVQVEGDGRRDERCSDARDDDRRYRPGRAGVGVFEQRDGLQDRRGDALQDALGDFAGHHRVFRGHRRARVVFRAVSQPPYLDGGLEAGQHQDKLFQHGQLAVVLGHDDGNYRLRSHK
jgi:hypothetical protein